MSAKTPATSITQEEFDEVREILKAADEEFDRLYACITKEAPRELLERTLSEARMDCLLNPVVTVYFAGHKYRGIRSPGSPYPIVKWVVPDGRTIKAFKRPAYIVTRQWADPLLTRVGDGLPSTHPAGTVLCARLDQDPIGPVRFRTKPKE